ncbi:MAG TPA: hypothetical protein VHE78_10530, partial [Gemmatimonadaceae bacterium]|nr:hypothetical protein [Gemmatimonadaceae bacterium]
RSEHVDVHSFNFSPAGTQEREYGAALARAAGTTHEGHDDGDRIDSHLSITIANARVRSTAPVKLLVERPHLIWSGDGGSVTLGHVYLRPAIIARAMAGDVGGVADAYLEAEHGYVPPRLVRSRVAQRMAAAPREGVIAELERLKTHDLSQTFYLFLMHNDQHRHLHRHFELMDEHRVEFQLPFFDSEFVAIIASIPIEARLYHAFYVTWLKEFPEYVWRTPWQAYPGHVPCPIPSTRPLAYQWDRSVLAAKRRQIRRTTLRRAMATLAAPRFASAFMKRHVLAIATMLHASGLRQYDELIEAAYTMQQHWDVTEPPSS